MFIKKDMLIKTIFIVIGGGASALAFAPFNYIPLLYLGYFILFYSIYKAKNLKESIYYGLIFGISHFLVGTYWLFTISNNYTGSNKIVLIIIIFGIILILSSYYAFFAFVAQLFKSRIKKLYIWIVLILPILATLMQWLKSWFLTGFTWIRPSDALFNFGYSYLLPITGPLGIELIFFIFISLLLLIFIYKNISSLFTLFLFMLIFIGSSKYLKNINFTTPLNKKLTIEAIASNFSRDSKSKEYMVIDRVKKFYQLSIQEPLPNLVIWPESTLSIDNFYIQNKLKHIFRVFKDKNVSLLYGVYTNNNGKQYNAIKNEDNKIVYIKSHLIPFGEYIPKWFYIFKKYLPSFFMDELESVNFNKPLNINNIKISLSICYELLFSDEIRKTARDSNLIINISDLGWFKHSIAQKYILEIARERAIENQKPLILVSNQGVTAFINNKGEVEKIVSNNKTLTLYNTIYPREGTTPYSKYGDRLIVIFLTLLLLIYLYIKFIKKESYAL